MQFNNHVKSDMFKKQDMDTILEGLQSFTQAIPPSQQDDKLDCPGKGGIGIPGSGGSVQEEIDEWG